MPSAFLFPAAVDPASLMDQRRAQLSRASIPRHSNVVSQPLSSSSEEEEPDQPCLCGKPALFDCTACEVQGYCSVDCQRAHWPKHALACPTLRKNALEETARREAERTGRARLSTQQPASAAEHPTQGKAATENVDAAVGPADASVSEAQAAASAAGPGPSQGGGHNPAPVSASVAPGMATEPGTAAGGDGVGEFATMITLLQEMADDPKPEVSPSSHEERPRPPTRAYDLTLGSAVLPKRRGVVEDASLSSASEDEAVPVLGGVNRSIKRRTVQPRTQVVDTSTSAKDSAMIPNLEGEGSATRRLSSSPPKRAILQMPSKRRGQAPQRGATSGGRVGPTAGEIGKQHVGCRVAIAGAEQYGQGVLRFIGTAEFAAGAGDWLGIELDEAVGKNDGSVAGKRYFQCDEKRGIFVSLRSGKARLLEFPDEPGRKEAWHDPSQRKVVPPSPSAVTPTRVAVQPSLVPSTPVSQAAPHSVARVNVQTGSATRRVSFIDSEVNAGSPEEEDDAQRVAAVEAGLARALAATKASLGGDGQATAEHKEEPPLEDTRHAPEAETNALHRAAQRGNRPRIARILAQGAIDIDSLDSYGRTALMHAVHYDHLDCVDL